VHPTDVPRDILAPADQGLAELLNERVVRVGAAVDGPAAEVDRWDATRQRGVTGLLDEPAAEARSLEDLQMIRAER
jgi:hypothetical protein